MVMIIMAMIIIMMIILMLGMTDDHLLSYPDIYLVCSRP